MVMAYGRLDKDTLSQVRKYVERHDSEIRQFFKMKPDVRIGFDKTLKFMLKSMGEWQ